LKASQQVMSPGFNILIRPQNVCTIADRCRSKDAQGYRDEKVMRTIFFTARTPIVFDTLSKVSEFNQLYFVDYSFPDLQMERWNFHHRIR
jgi:hypothetical protein